MAKQANKFEGMKVVTPIFRASFLNVFKPKAFVDASGNEGPEKYSVQMLYDKKRTDLTKFKEQMKQVAIKAWGKDKAKWPKNFSWPFNDGDNMPDDLSDDAKAVYAGHTYCNADSKQPPGIYDQNKEDIMDEKEFYSGCYARASVFMVPYQDIGGRGEKGRSGIKLYLQGIQMVKKGEKLGRDSRNDFDVIENEEGGDDSTDSGDDDLGI